MGLKIGEHDLQVKLRNARKFLDEGNKVKISLIFRGREITHPDLRSAIMARVQEQLADIGEVEQPPQMTGRDLNMIIGKKKDAEAQKPQRNDQTN